MSGVVCRAPALDHFVDDLAVLATIRVRVVAMTTAAEGAGWFGDDIFIATQPSLGNGIRSATLAILVSVAPLRAFAAQRFVGVVAARAALFLRVNLTPEAAVAAHLVIRVVEFPVAALPVPTFIRGGNRVKEAAGGV